MAPSDPILVDDGRALLEVGEVSGGELRTRVVVGGVVSDYKGLNLPGVPLSVPALTEKAASDLREVLGLRADMIALSLAPRSHGFRWPAGPRFTCPAGLPAIIVTWPVRDHRKSKIMVMLGPIASLQSQPPSTPQQELGISISDTVLDQWRRPQWRRVHSRAPKASGVSRARQREQRDLQAPSRDEERTLRRGARDRRSAQSANVR